MTVLRIVPDFGSENPQQEASFYERLFDLDIVMDQGFIVTVASDERAKPQLSIMKEGGSGAPVPSLSIEVDDVEEAHRRAQQLDAEIVYPITNEPWGVRRFFVKDPSGRILNILQHTS
ncbi:VOC family protein [Pseudoblastomonas halimionae]|uniref:Glyoxalase n=1 Tax=Alteriqipengyuania halimionae TaxID=1926630 RepID=A0A6I4U8J6_9SPHN|nr:VOC family protein [Alteriqipengyuania halimionae]MXP10802.1 glyoxalase [Alteriqipengyuania halimionae]